MPLAEGPADYFGGTIETFALPFGALILAAIVLYFLFRAQHSGPKLKYLATGSFTSIGTREPGPVPAPPVTATVSEHASESATTAESESTTEPEPEK